MKIAVATDDYTNVTGHVGRCTGFLVFDLENGTITNSEKRENIFTHHRMRGEGHHSHGEGEHKQGHGHGHARLVEGLKDCTALICHVAGWRLAEELTQNNISVIMTDENNAEQAVIKYDKGELNILEDGACHSH